MYKDLLQTTPLLVLPLVALFLFLAVFVAIVARVVTRAPAEVLEAARLPLDTEGGRHGR